MLRWLHNALCSKRGPLTGAPAIRRQKTYSAESGYVYQYYYEGSRAIEGGREYVFMATAGRRAEFPVAVVLRDSALDPWQRSHGRDLTGPERFAVAKLSMKRAFDERGSPDLMRHFVEPDSSLVEEILIALGVDE
jgi:hypothetical protein